MNVAEKHTDISEKKILQLFVVVITVLIVAVYGSSLQNEFINFDDPEYITQNPYIASGLTMSSVTWAMIAGYSANWHPLTWISHAIDIQLFGFNPAGHHLVNVLFHGANSLLLLALLARITGKPWRSGVVALLFAIHPLHVESVAWASQRKDVLATFFMLLAILNYYYYTMSRSIKKYIIMALLFFCGLMSKPTVITMPILLILLDYWPLGRLQLSRELHCSDVKQVKSFTLLESCREKLPLFVLSALSAIITVIVQKNGGSMNQQNMELIGYNAGNAILAYCRYIGKMVWPGRLSILYPFDFMAVTPLAVVAALCFLVCIFLLIIRVGRNVPGLITGWLWYVVSLVPMIGIVSVGAHSMADRYTYIPLIGLFIVVVWGGGKLAEKMGITKLACVAITTAAVLLLSSVTFLQVRRWRDSVTLYEHALHVTRDNWLMHNNLGAVILDQNLGDDLAMMHFQECLRINPANVLSHENIGRIFYKSGNQKGAFAAFSKAAEIDPKRPIPHYALGIIYMGYGNREAALTEYLILKSIDQEKAEKLKALIDFGNR